MFNKYVGNSKGFTMIQLMLVIVFAVSLTVLTVSIITNSNKTKEESVVTANISQLESVAKTYYTNKNQYPVKEAVKISEFTNGTAMKTFYDAFKKVSSQSEEQINDRLKIVDFETLKAETYLSTKIDNPDDYVLYKMSGKVYNIRRDATIKELEDLSKTIISDAGEVIDLNKNTEFVIKDATGKMDTIYATVTQGNKMVVGGDGVIKLAVVTLSDNNGEVSHEVKNLTGKIVAEKPGAKAVTDIVLVDTGKVLVHYFDGSELAYQTIEF